MGWLNKCDELPKQGEYVLIYPPYISGAFDDEPRHVVKWHQGRFVYYLGGSIHDVTWGGVTHWASLPVAPTTVADKSVGNLSVKRFCKERKLKRKS